MNCDRCNSERVVSISGKCSDLFNANYSDKELTDYVPNDMGIGGGDYIEFSYCLECGKIQGEFPIPDPEFSRLLTNSAYEDTYRARIIKEIIIEKTRMEDGE